MLRLGNQEDPYWIDLPFGVRAKVRPLTYPVNEAALAAARNHIKELLESSDNVEEAGGSVEGLPDLETEEGRAGYFQFVYVEQLANASILKWTGVGDEHGNDVEPDPVWVRLLMMKHNVAEQFIDKYTAHLAKGIAEGNASGTSPDGSSDGVPDTAQAAK